MLNPQIIIKIMNTKRHKGRLNCFVTCSIKDRQPIEIDFEKNCEKVERAFVKFVIYFLVKHTKTKEIYQKTKEYNIVVIHKMH